jgi:hypothetical protein
MSVSLLVQQCLCCKTLVLMRHRLDHPLAEDFPLDDGEVSFVVPTPPPKPDNTYFVALVGDSGNISPEFQIII